MLCDCKHRGTTAPALAVRNGALGFRKGLRSLTVRIGRGDLTHK
jgi:hypothetical protein